MFTEIISSEVEIAGVTSHVFKKLLKWHSIKLCKYKYKKTSWRSYGQVFRQVLYKLKSLSWLLLNLLLYNSCKKMYKIFNMSFPIKAESMPHPVPVFSVLITVMLRQKVWHPALLMCTETSHLHKAVIATMSSLSRQQKTNEGNKQVGSRSTTKERFPLLTSDMFCNQSLRETILVPNHHLSKCFSAPLP